MYLYIHIFFTFVDVATLTVEEKKKLFTVLSCPES